MNESNYLEFAEADPDPVAKGTSQERPLKWHGRLEWLEEKLLITDLGGRQPVEVNGKPLQPLQPRIVRAGDAVLVGGTEITFHKGATGQRSLEAAGGEKRHRLVVSTPEWSREIELRDPLIKLGRAEGNDIIINDSGVSRFHARLEKSNGGYEIIDQESTFGIRIDGRAVTRRMLVDGDKLEIADDVRLSYQVIELPAQVTADGAHEPGEDTRANAGPGAGEDGQALPFVGQTSFIDMARMMEADAPLPRASGLWETMEPHLVVHLADETWQALFTKDHMTIGRGDDNDIVIPDSSVSRQHAVVDRLGSEFVIRDANSDNGVWIGKRRVVESHSLQAGDVVSLGRVKVVFKSGFAPQDLTLISSPSDEDKRTRRPVVFVPGLGGSELWLGSERVFPSPKVLISNPEILSLPGDPRVEARRIVGDVVIVPGIIKQEQYSRLGDYLENGLGYTRGKDLLEFPYDWRQDLRSSARKLAKAIDEWDPGAPVTIIGHSLGTLVTRYYVERLGGKRSVERIILMGGPQYGTPKALAVMFAGPGILPFGISNDRIRRMMVHFPTAYQILPIYPCVFDQTGQQVHVMEDDEWLPESQRPYLKLAREFRRELGSHSSVPAVSIFGYGYNTAVRVNVRSRSDGSWESMDFVEKNAGDLSIPAGSAVLKDSEIHPVYQEHGALYVDNDVKMRLKVELTRSTTLEGKRI